MFTHSCFTCFSSNPYICVFCAKNKNKISCCSFFCKQRKVLLLISQTQISYIGFISKKSVFHSENLLDKTWSLLLIFHSVLQNLYCLEFLYFDAPKPNPEHLEDVTELFTWISSHSRAVYYVGWTGGCCHRTGRSSWKRSAWSFPYKRVFIPQCQRHRWRSAWSLLVGVLTLRCEDKHHNHS